MKPVSTSYGQVAGLSAVVIPLLYLASEVVETAQGSFTTFRLVLTYVGEAGLPFVVLGLWAALRPTTGRLGLAGAVVYAYSFVFFSATVIYALAAGAPDWPSVVDRFGPWLTVHGALMVIGGLTFGIAVVRTRSAPAWTGVCLAVGVVLVAALSGESNLLRTLAAAVPNLALAGMGVALLRQGAPAGHQAEAAAEKASSPGGRAL